MSFYFYLARCSDNSLYAGSCKNIQQREQAHNSPKNGAKYTRARQPVKIIYFEEHTNRSEAVKRECEIKKWNKIKKESLVNNLSK